MRIPYTKKVIQHFRKPKNMGKIENADGVGEAGNLVCGDFMKMYIKVEKGKIKDIKFQTLGCVAAIATSSIATTLAKGKTLEEALKLTNKDILKALGGLPPIKLHCSLLAIDALREAIFDYFKKSGKEIPEWLKKEHERIGKEKRVIEEKYKEFAEMQRKILR